MKKGELLFIIILIFFNACTETSTDPIISEPETVFKMEYTVNPPDGFSPYPHHNPEFDQNTYDVEKNKIYIINNFGLYQANKEATVKYFHSGLDFVYPNKTKIFSINAGRVVLLETERENYYYMAIQDLDNPEYAWLYAHINNIQFELGDTVKQGEYICDIKFNGLEHLHLNRMKQKESGYIQAVSDLYEVYYSINPIKYFDIPDTEPPIAKDKFYYFVDGTDNQIDKSSVSGKVDIVIGARDGGEFEHDRKTLFGDRNAITKINYEILKNGNVVEKFQSIDFSKILIGDEEAVDILYKHYMLFETDRVYSKNFNYYIITNNNGNIYLSENDKNLCWDTTEKLSDGSAKYPDGEYTIKVYIYDDQDNETVVENIVEIKNKAI